MYAISPLKLVSSPLSLSPSTQLSNNAILSDSSFRTPVPQPRGSNVYGQDALGRDPWGEGSYEEEASGGQTFGEQTREECSQMMSSCLDPKPSVSPISIISIPGSGRGLTVFVSFLKHAQTLSVRAFSSMAMFALHSKIVSSYIPIGLMMELTGKKKTQNTEYQLEASISSV